MKSIIEFKDLKIEVEKKKIKNLYLKIKNTTGDIFITAPIWMKDEKIVQFIHKRENWIRGKLDKIEDKTIIEKVNLDSLDYLDVFGDKLEVNIKYVDKNPLYLKRRGDIVTLYIKSDTSEKRQREIIRAWYRENLMKEIGVLIGKWESIMDIQVNEFRTKSMKTRWGTCNISKRRIWINLELAKIPKEYLEYVVVHEMAHLFESGHGARFQKLMDSYYPNWRVKDVELNRYIIEK